MWHLAGAAKWVRWTSSSHVRIIVSSFLYECLSAWELNIWHVALCLPSRPLGSLKKTCRCYNSTHKPNTFTSINLHFLNLKITFTTHLFFIIWRGKRVHKTEEGLHNVCNLPSSWMLPDTPGNRTATIKLNWQTKGEHCVCERETVMWREGGV